MHAECVAWAFTLSFLLSCAAVDPVRGDPVAGDNVAGDPVAGDNAARGHAAGAATGELLIVDGRVYTLDWTEPDRDGTPADDAPHDSLGWRPDAEAVLIRDGTIVFTGTTADARRRAGSDVRVLDARGATVLPGFIESHTHVAELGRNLSQVNLVGIADEAAAIAKVAARAREVEPGKWILGFGWDEGAWANHYPTMDRLSAAVPDHPTRVREHVGNHRHAAFQEDLVRLRGGRPVGKLVQAKRETFALGLYVGLLTGPTVKKCFLLHICRECTEHSALSRREESLGDLLICQLRANTFEINAKLSTTSDGVERKPVGVGHVEAESIPASLSNQEGLPMGSIAKSQMTGFYFQVLA